MASKCLALVPKVPISSSLVQSALQLKSPPAISFKDLQDVLKRTVSDINKEIKDLIMAERAVIEETMEKRNKEIRKDLLDVFQNLAFHTDKTTEMEFRTTEVEEVTQDGSALCIRGLKENLQENLKMLIVKDIAFNSGCRSEEVGDETEKIYRVNSRIARQKMLSRDVVVYSSRKEQVEMAVLNFETKEQMITRAAHKRKEKITSWCGWLKKWRGARKEQVEMAVLNFETKEQMITQAAHKRKEKEKQQKLSS